MGQGKEACGSNKATATCSLTMNNDKTAAAPSGPKRRLRNVRKCAAVRG